MNDLHKLPVIKCQAICNNDHIYEQKIDQKKSNILQQKQTGKKT